MNTNDFIQTINVLVKLGKHWIDPERISHVQGFEDEEGESRVHIGSHWVEVQMSPDAVLAEIKEAINDDDKVWVLQKSWPPP